MEILVNIYTSILVSSNKQKMHRVILNEKEIFQLAKEKLIALDVIQESEYISRI